MKERILSILEKDARASYENIATMLGITVEEVKKTVDECVADGTIIAYRTVIDWDKTRGRKRSVQIMVIGE